MNYKDIKLPDRPEPDGFITDGPFDKPVVINVYRDSTLEAYAREAVRMNSCESRASTHAEGCWFWGPGHYECAVGQVERDEALLRQALEVLGRARQTAMEQTLKARIPECAEFAGIVQDLDFVVAALRERLGRTAGEVK